MLGRLVPFGIGAVIGGAGNRYLAKKVIENAAVAFEGIDTISAGQLELDDPDSLDTEIVEKKRKRK